MTYSRDNPSPHYFALIEQYQEMHAKRAFQGIGVYKFQKELRKLIRETGSRTVLDYGCAQGTHLQPGKPDALFAKLGIFASSWTEALGAERISGYDPATEDFHVLPQGQFDGVTCTDVLEHISENDLSWIIDEIFSYALKFVFLTVAMAPAKKNLPNGENAHVTLKSQDWWFSLIDGIAKRYPHVRYEVVFEEEILKEKHHVE